MLIENVSFPCGERAEKQNTLDLIGTLKRRREFVRNVALLPAFTIHKSKHARSLDAQRHDFIMEIIKRKPVSYDSHTPTEHKESQRLLFATTAHQSPPRPFIPVCL